MKPAVPRRALQVVGSLFMLAGLLAWLLGTPYFFRMARHVNACTDPDYGSMMLLAVCGVGGPLLVAAGLGLARRRRGALIWIALALVTLVGLCAVGAVALDQVRLEQSYVRCDG
ncbi:hypothetical protein ABT369_30785 [Dactylosporangium sp. NPDC000244]|uniref:hypothetical protein n=1 Tax=Dactylosporangium sp. NPDC000244 TaxID=3154365 RepID=UPI00331C28CC